MKSESPAKTAVIQWPPTVRAEVVNVAMPDPFSIPVPRLVEPFSKVTMPVGVPAPGASALIVAVKVTVWP